MRPGAASRGVVREFDPDEGWGVIDGPDVPGGCWVSFASIAGDGYRRLAAGQDVSFRATPADQDGYRFRAEKVWLGADEPADSQPDRRRSGAYRSLLILEFDEPGGSG